MDPTRISIARILALNVPLTWQEAVAVAHEAAMVSDVYEAMNEHASLVTAETCYVTVAGELELPETTDDRSPPTVAALLRLLLPGQELPEGLEAVASGVAVGHDDDFDVPDLSAALSAFPVGNRRALIAQLATRALAQEPRTSSASTATVAAVVPAAAATPPETTTRRWAPMVPAATAAPTAARVMAVPPAAVVSPNVELPAAARPEAASPAPPAVAGSQPAAESELRQLRMRAVERDKINSRSSGRLARALQWRPTVRGALVLGGGAVVLAAVAVWWRGPVGTPQPGGVTAAPAASLSAPAAIRGTGDAPPVPQPVAVPTPAIPSARRTARSNRPAERAPASASPAAAEPSRSPSIVVLPQADERRGAALPSGSPVVTSVMAPSASVPRPAPAPPAAVGPPSSEDGRRRASPRAGGRASRPALPYSPSDVDVTPPVMLRQQLPTNVLEPGSDVPADWPFLEVLIDEQGAVERVRLRAKTPPSGQTLYRHRMLVAAAKAWQFEPARREGQPVRYELRVPLEP